MLVIASIFVCDATDLVVEPLIKHKDNSQYPNTFLDLREEDSLSIMDKMAGFKVSFIWRFH